MLKNMNLAPKLILIGGLLIIIPLIIVGTIAINQASNGLKNATSKELAARSKGLAKLVDTILEEQLKYIENIAITPDVVRAAEAVANKGVDGAQEELNSLNAFFVKIKNTKRLEEHLQGIALVATNSTLVASTALYPYI